MRFLWLLLISLLIASPACADSLTGRDTALEETLCGLWRESLAAVYEDGAPIPSADGYTPNWGCVIKRGGDTRELIAQKKHWELAIVSADDVDLQRLADAGILHAYPYYYPDGAVERHQWLHRDLWQLLPRATDKRYDVFIYDRTDNDITLLLCNGSTARKRGGNAQDYALTLLAARTPEQMRRTDGFALVQNLRPQQLLTMDSASWDAAILIMDADDPLTELDQAGLLLDLRQNAFLAAHQPLVRKKNVAPHTLAAGVYADDGRMLALPIAAHVMDRNGSAQQLRVIVVNPRSSCISEALAWTEHHIRSVIWRWQWQDAGRPCPFDRRDLTW